MNPLVIVYGLIAVGLALLLTLIRDRGPQDPPNKEDRR